MKANLVNLDDIREFWAVSQNLEDNRVLTHVIRAQENNLQKVISPPIYLLMLGGFVQDYKNQEFDTLRYWTQAQSGVQFTTIEDGGIQVALIAGQISARVFQRVNVKKNVPFTFIIDLDGIAGNVIEVFGADRPDLSDAEILSSSFIDDPVTAIPVTPLSSYRYVGFRIICVDDDTLIINSVRLGMEERLDRLWNGEIYRPVEWPQQDVRFPGVKELLCAYSYDNILTNNQIHVTRGGVNKKFGEQSENATDKNVSVKSSEAYSEAIRLEREFLQWMEARSGYYPEYTCSTVSTPVQPMFWNASRPQNVNPHSKRTTSLKNSPWLLAGGIWNDNGYWNDSQNWID